MTESGSYFTFQLKNNNKKALEEVFFSFYDQLCQYAYLFTNEQDASEKIIQDLFINIWEKRASLQINTSLIAYLYFETKNRALNFIKSNNKLLENLDYNSKNNLSNKLTTNDLDNYSLLQMFDEVINSISNK